MATGQHPLPADAAVPAPAGAHKLQVGAFGSLGVLLEAHFKVNPRPVARGVLLLACERASQALELLLEVRGLPLGPVALEALDAGAAQELRDTKELGGLLPGGT